MDADESLNAFDGVCAPTDDLSNSLLGFSANADELELQSVKRQKTSRDPMSHRIIEKRRRDRMNNCLADLSRLIPTSYLKQGQGRIEKTEIIEMAIKHIKTLQAQVDRNQLHSFTSTKTPEDTALSSDVNMRGDHVCCQERFQLGFKECQDETLHYFVEGEALLASDPFCVRVMEHLSSAAQQFLSPYGGREEKRDSAMELEGMARPSGGPGEGRAFLSTISPHTVAGGAARDKHLHGLLGLRSIHKQESVPVSKEYVEPASLPSKQLHPTQPAYAVSVSSDSGLSPGIRKCESGLNEGASSGYISDMSTMDRLSNGSLVSTSPSPSELALAGKDNSAANIYKFKHNITKRFSQEGKVIPNQYECSSSSSKEADEELLSHSSMKYRTMKNKCRHPSSSDSGPYPTSEASCTAGSSSPDSMEGPVSKEWRRKVSGHSTITLPGFVLHPSGTHYLPLSVCRDSNSDLFEMGVEAGLDPPVFHPISIPVHFKGPVISMPGSGSQQHSHPVVSYGSVPKDTKISKKRT